MHVAQQTEAKGRARAEILHPAGITECPHTYSQAKGTPTHTTTTARSASQDRLLVHLHLHTTTDTKIPPTKANSVPLLVLFLTCSGDAGTQL